MTIYDKVKAEADKQKKSISAIETEAGLSNGTISGWKQSRPYAESLQKVAAVLNVPMTNLLT